MASCCDACSTALENRCGAKQWLVGLTMCSTNAINIWRSIDPGAVFCTIVSRAVASDTETIGNPLSVALTAPGLCERHVPLARQNHVVVYRQIENPSGINQLTTCGTII